MVKVILRNITKRFGNVIAADKITLEIKHGEFFTFLGPSGCGKTTTLRIIAGLELPDEGQVFFDENNMTNLPPYKRDTGMVFQNYALWPHMTVFDNIAYGLRIRKLSREEIRRRVLEVLDLVKLRGLENRYPTQLSGGQQQRVALARALVVEPKVLLLDEPLSNLDAKLRIEMREEIKKLQKKLGITAIYVTHDQEEAMVISERVAIMNKGKIMQIGAPKEVYRRPKNLFVATFLGRCSMVEGYVKKVLEDKAIVVAGNLKIKGIIPSTDIKIKEDDKVACIMRPEDFDISGFNDAYNVFVGKIEWPSFVGPYTQVRINVNGFSLLVNLDPDYEIKTGQEITVGIKESNVIILPIKGVEELAYGEKLK